MRPTATIAIVFLPVALDSTQFILYKLARAHKVVSFLSFSFLGGLLFLQVEAVSKNPKILRKKGESLNSYIFQSADYNFLLNHEMKIFSE